MKHQLVLLSQHYSLCYLRLVIKRSYDWMNPYNGYSNDSVHHAIFNQAGDLGLLTDLECQLSAIEMKRYSNEIPKMDLVLRRPLRKLLDIKGPLSR